MAELNKSGWDNAAVARADELFRQHRQEIFVNTDQLFRRLMICQWLVGILMAFLISPYTWSGQSSQIHLHVWAAIFIGGVITTFPVWMTRAWPGAVMTRHVIAVAQMLMSALLISLSGGRIETHFHVFGSLVILSFYRDWRVLIPATIVVGLDHFLRGIYWPYSVYGVLAASPLRSIEHAGWVLFEDAFLVISCLRSVREMRSIANRRSALEASEQKSREIFEEAPIGMAVVDLDHCFVQANAAFSQMMGYSNLELRDRTPRDITFPDDVEQEVKLAEEMINGRERCCIEKRYVRKNGDVLWANRTACLIRDEDQKPRHFLIMVEDISERKRADKALRESKHRLETALHANQAIMDNSQDVICTVDEAGRFLTVNAACQDLWGYSPEELIGRDYIDMVHPDDRSKTIAANEDLLRAGKVTDFVNRYVRKDGTIVDVLWSASWSATDKLCFCVAHNVTERQRIEKDLREAKNEAERANSAKSEFLSRMSHELRTPLNAIIGFGQLLERQKPTEKQIDRIDHILKAGRHLLGLINEVLDISRIEAGCIQLSLEPVCVDQALDEAIDLMRPMAAERTIALSSTSKDETCYVLADRQRFKQVLLNLLTNAVKYTPAGGKVDISYTRTDDANVRIIVTDSGKGIPREKLSRLFTPFDRLGAEQSAVEGTGLGLALCQRLMHAMRGSIGVDSAVGRGSTFWVDLPRSESPLRRLSSRDDATTLRKGGSAESGKRVILYIEDNLSNLTLIEQLLEDQPDVKFMTAMQGQLGLDLARQHLPDLILLDLHLPDIPGWDVLSQLQASESTRNIPVIVISADATKRQVDKLMAKGARAYLTKPLDVGKFFQTLEDVASSTNGVKVSVAA